MKRPDEEKQLSGIFFPGLLSMHQDILNLFFFQLFCFFLNLKISFSVFFIFIYFGLFCPPYHQGQGKQDLLFEIMLNLNV